ncbi:MAG: putative camp-dependent protein kinase catalytic subunit, partial [Streblomastix strix]
MLIIIHAPNPSALSQGKALIEYASCYHPFFTVGAISGKEELFVTVDRVVLIVLENFKTSLAFHVTVITIVVIAIITAFTSTFIIIASATAVTSVAITAIMGLIASGRFDTATTRFFAAQLVCALAFMHKEGIAYRDLKPENILLDKNGQLKLADFSFAKKIDDLTFTLCGTPEYMAPEVV